MRTRRCPRFEKRYNRLPKELQKQTDKALRLFDTVPRPNGLRLKQTGQNLWAIRVNRKYRILGILDGNLESGTMVWYWVGRHGGPYERELRRMRSR